MSTEPCTEAREEGGPVTHEAEQGRMVFEQPLILIGQPPYERAIPVSDFTVPSPFFRGLACAVLVEVVGAALVLIAWAWVADKL